MFSFGGQHRHQSISIAQDQFWKKVPQWKHVSTEEFTSYRFQLRHTVHKAKLCNFLGEALPDRLAPSANPLLQKIRTKSDFIKDVLEGLELAPMAIRLTPHLLARVNWEQALDDPIRMQFIPLRSALLPDIPGLTLDSLHEEADSPVPGLVHRYPGRALFITTSICPVYCRFCTRSRAVGPNTDTVLKAPQKPSRTRWELVFEYIEKNESIHDIVVSGGDAYYLQPEQLKEIGERLLSIKHIQRFRFGSKGLAVAPGRITDRDDAWASTLIDISNQGRRLGKQVSLHTHFNHPEEINWITRDAANHLYAHGVVVRNQSVLLKGVNDDHETMGELLNKLAGINIQPYYVYQCDLVRGIEDLRTPLDTILNMDKHIRGTLSGFMTPSFVVDLPGGGGKRLCSTYESYHKGIAKYRAPGLPGEKGRKEYTYYDPDPNAVENELRIRQHQHEEDVATIPAEAVMSAGAFIPAEVTLPSEAAIPARASLSSRAAPPSDIPIPSEALNTMLQPPPDTITMYEKQAASGGY
ncbi:hypothetical protein BDV95DRAFT_505777 [Massariosphaeria phaeospora]|uniref:Radical SAM core domain-containing protein n=1 Tax=Massariosphaeria phaeospora TaxID=100035 RepID=A0A7C8I0S3_9PLEO|nr:hypothetical protein BDV95DRAFT_505777 [Massariosphaeria phaeospora]